MTRQTGSLSSALPISTHTPLAGRDIPHPDVSDKTIISTHTPLAGRDDDTQVVGLAIAISTHTPLAGRDNTSVEKACVLADFYSHSPCGT